MIPTVKASIGYKGRYIVTCPFCKRTHTHNPPLGEGQRMADCFRGEYIIVIAEPEPTAAELIRESEVDAGEPDTEDEDV